MERSFVAILKSSSPFSQALQEQVEVRVSKGENKLETMLKHTFTVYLHSFTLRHNHLYSGPSYCLKNQKMFTV